MVKVDDIYHDLILDLFHHRCVRCGKSSETVHELVPRSRRPNTWWFPSNRVVLCFECHFWSHSRGAKSSADELRNLREKRLKEYLDPVQALVNLFNDLPGDFDTWEEIKNEPYG